MSAYDLSKRGLDVAIAGVVLVVAAVPMVAIAALIKADSPGPVLYVGERLGKDRRVFKQLKFRTMIANAPNLRNRDGSTLSTAHDPRVTRIGKLLRKSSLDELPQLVNILRGDMSLVGPRPDPPDAMHFYREKDFDRLSVMPGLTGWAQIHGRNRVPWEKRRDLDLDYVGRRTMALDLKVLVLTVPLALTGKGVLAAPES